MRLTGRVHVGLCDPHAGPTLLEDLGTKPLLVEWHECCFGGWQGGMRRDGTRPRRCITLIVARLRRCSTAYASSACGKQGAQIREEHASRARRSRWRACNTGTHVCVGGTVHGGWGECRQPMQRPPKSGLWDQQAAHNLEDAVLAYRCKLGG